MAIRQLTKDEVEETLASNARASNREGGEIRQVLLSLEIGQGFELGPFETEPDYHKMRSSVSMKLRSIPWYVPNTGCIRMRKIIADGQFYLRVIRDEPIS